MTATQCFFAVCLLLSSSFAAEWTFPSGEVLTAVDESTLDGTTITQVEDPLSTGTPLFESSTPLDDNVQLARNFRVKTFRYPGSQLDYYRAHPALFTCLQRVYDHVYNTANKQVRLSEGYMTADERGGTTSAYELYARTGCGAALEVKAATTTEDDVEAIAEAVLTYCPFIFSLEQRDIGVVALTDRVYVYMAAPDVTAPLFMSVDYSKLNDAAFKTWCKDKIDESLMPRKLPECKHYSGLSSSGVFPLGSTMDQAVGSLDVAVTRQEMEDFKRLIQFSGRNVEFEDSESGSSWCGFVGNECVDCGSQIVGQIPESRCADRLMSARLYNVIKSLHALVSVLMDPLILHVEEAWDEPHSGATSGDSPAGSQHFEGRAAVIKLSASNSADNMETLTKYAICAGADYVKNEGDKVTIAVKKQAGLTANYVRFPMKRMLAVTPPASLLADFSLPAKSNPENFPLFDSDNQESSLLGEYVTVGDVKSPSSRYFRVHPAIATCYDAIYAYDKRWAPDDTIVLDVVRGYMTEAEVAALYTPEYDKRRRSHAHGFAMHLKYGTAMHGGNFSMPQGTKYSAHRLAMVAILNCAPILAEQGWEMGVGLYDDGVFVDMRENFQVWVNDPTMLPPGESRDNMKKKYLLAVDYRMFNPDNPAAAYMAGSPPMKQSSDYQYVHADYIHQRRRKRATGAGDGNECTPETDTEFCIESKPHRDTEVAYIFSQLKRKHFFRFEDDVLDALENCLGACGTCLKGQFWEDKVLHCNNLLHWMNFELMNEEAGVTNLYYRGNRQMKTYACHVDRHCVDKAPLLAILASSVEELYRADPKSSIEDELYGSTDNPLPVFEIVYQIYGMHANGTVTVWVKDETEMEYLRVSLMPIMVYNPAVTKVNVYVLDEERKPNVANTLNNMIRDWTTTVHPELTMRDATPPYAIRSIHSGIAKRDLSVDRDFSEELALKRKNYEKEWMAKIMT